MYAEALKSGVMLQRFQDLKLEDRAEMTLPEDSPLIAKYLTYMAHLPQSNSSLESLIQAHRIAQFHWRSAITKAGQDTRVLGSLYRQVNAAMCEAVPARNRHKSCSPKEWKYELPHKPDEQAKQLLGEHRRLVRQIPFIREPMERQGDTEVARQRSEYEDIIIQAWDAATPLPDEIEAFLAAHVHDSVAHFTEWPCALYDQRGIYCDKDRYLAKANQNPVSSVT